MRDDFQGVFIDDESGYNVRALVHDFRLLQTEGRTSAPNGQVGSEAHLRYVQREQHRQQIIRRRVANPLYNYYLEIFKHGSLSAL